MPAALLGELVVIDAISGELATTGGTNWRAELWDMVSTPSRAQSVPVVAGHFWFDGPVPAVLAITVRSLAADADLEGPIFRSRVILAPSLGPGPIRVEAALTPRLRVAAAELGNWFAAAQLSSPVPVGLGIGVGSVDFTVGSSGVVLTQGGARVSVSGELAIRTAAGHQLEAFTAAAMISLRPSNAPGGADICELTILGAPEVSIPGLPGALLSPVLPVIGGLLADSLLNELQARIRREIAAVLAAAIAPAVPPSGATVSLPVLTIDPAGASVQGAFGAFGTSLSSMLGVNGRLLAKEAAVTRFLWTQREDIGPPPRAAHGLAFDAARKRVVLFGGSGGNAAYGDTWEWDGQYWTQTADFGPAPRSGHSLAHDAARNSTVLFGGQLELKTIFGDTWEWDGAAWTQTADTGPSPRWAHAMAFDTARSRIVLFGGASREGALLGDTWEFDGTEWTQVQDVGPDPRQYHQLAYDFTAQKILLYGGNAAGGAMGDTWEFDGVDWTKIADTGPGPRAGATMASGGNIVILHGGISSLTPQPDTHLYGDSWAWQDRQWTQLQDIGPVPRWAHSAGFDTIRQLMVIFGGQSTPPGGDPSGSLLGDTWESSALQPPAPPPSPALAMDTISIQPTTWHAPNAPDPAPAIPVTVTVIFKHAAPPNASVQIGVQNPGDPSKAVLIAVNAVPAGATDSQTTLSGDAVQQALLAIGVVAPGTAVIFAAESDSIEATTILTVSTL